MNGIYYEHNGPLKRVVEFWKPITNNSVPNVKPFYWVSSFGRLFNIHNNNFVPQFNDGKRGYLLVTLATDNGNITKSVHRIVMLEFVGHDPDPNKIEVDHISGIKYDNSIYNLRWVTPSENVIAAYDNGLMPSGEDSPLAKLSNDDVHKICQMMQDGRPREEIYALLYSKGIAYPDTLFNSIYTRRAWKRISKDYVFQDYSERTIHFSNEQIHEICKYLEQKLDQKSILINLGFSVDNMTRAELDRLYSALSHIKTGKYYTDISSQYNITDYNKNVFSDDQVHYICKRIKENIPNKEILQELGIYVNIKEDYHKYHRYMDTISRIRRGKYYTHITSQYNI